MLQRFLPILKPIFLLKRKDIDKHDYLNILKQIIMKQTFVSAIIIAFLVAMAPSGFAAGKDGREKDSKKESTAKPNVQLNYMGEEDNYVVLQVVLNKSDDKHAKLSISDGLGEELYTERFTQNSFARYIKVSPDELSNIEIVFETINGISRKKYNLNMSMVSTFKLEEVANK
jgi:hypothetical protein